MYTPKHLDSRLQAFEQCISFVSVGQDPKLRYGVMGVRG
jgi:hypothetical protein